MAKVADIDKARTERFAAELLDAFVRTAFMSPELPM